MHLRNLKLTGHVGFDSLPDQLVNKSVQNGFVFNILCISETGLGKSTLMDSLFNTNFESTPSPHTLPNVKLKAQTYELQESNVRLKVTFNYTLRAAECSILFHFSWQFAILSVMEIKSTRMIHSSLSLITLTSNLKRTFKRNSKSSALSQRIMIVVYMHVSISSVQRVTVWSHWISSAWKNSIQKSTSFQLLPKLIQFLKLSWRNSR